MCIFNLFIFNLDLLVIYVSFQCSIRFTNTFSSEILTFQNGHACNKSEYFSVNNLKCGLCDPTKNLVPSSNKLSCTCNHMSYQLKWNKEGLPECKKCMPGQMATTDGRFCISCTKSSHESTASKPHDKVQGCKKCLANEVMVEYSLNGSLFQERKCVECVPGTRPSSNGSFCEPCLNNLGSNESCSCPLGTHEQLAPDVCSPHHDLAAWPDDSSTYSVDYLLSHRTVQSDLLKNNLRRDIYLCKIHKKSLACQAVANMCVLTHYKDGPACSLFRDFKHIPSSEREPYPWLYYGDGDAPTVLSRRKIPTRFSLDTSSELRYVNLSVARWSPLGVWKGIEKARGEKLQLCPGLQPSQDGALRFATRYYHRCNIPIRQLLKSHRDTEILDLYLHYNASLYAVPVLNTNLQLGSRFPNREADISQWQLTRRFFLIDTISSIPVNGNKPEVIQYLRSATLRIRVQQGDDQGKMYPPLLVLEYGEVTAKDIESDTAVDLSFSVDFYMDSRITYTIDIWLGVTCGLAVVWSALQTWSHCRRSAHTTLDLLTIFQLLIITCGHVSNMFFAVVGLAAVHSFIYYKGQSVAEVLLPSSALDTYVYTYVIIAFSLKLVEVAALVWQQVTLDIFLIDWERPRASKDNSQPVSIWRTYFVANEWNEMQSQRKTSLTGQFICIVFLIKVIGIENWAVSDPDVNNHVSSEMLYRPLNFTLEFAVAILVYVFVYTIQWVFLSVFYERYIKNGIQEFVDVCSLANISVFILTLENFGYYIHGRSAHGFADTDMQTIMNQLMREEEDLVGHRGLLPASDHQTFQMYIPSQLRSYYQRVMPPPPMAKQPPTAVTTTLRLKLMGSSSADFDRSVVAYHNMNKFLAAFLEHALRDLDYEVRDKLFAEALLDIEFSDVPGKAVFYIDNGHSFDKVLFYGNEFTLFSMDLIVFCFFQVVTRNFLLAAILTVIIAKILMKIRHIGGRKNLAKKTLIDERFLI